MIAPLRPTHLAVRQGEWMYIGAQGGGGFSAKKVGDHGFGGPATQPFTRMINSDIAGGEVRDDAPLAQLYNLQNDPFERINVIREHPDIAKRMIALLAQLRSAPTRK